MGIHLSAGFGSVPSYEQYTRAFTIPKVTPEEIREKESKAQQEMAWPEIPKEKEKLPSLKEDTRSRTAELENISLTFNKEDSFDYIGSEKSLKNLDVQKAISDMQKDKVLQEYQYFVGSAQAVAGASEDGTVVLK